MSRSSVGLLTSVVVALLSALPTSARAQNGEPRQESGVLNGAPYDISVPADWNGGLVMYVHGYQVQPRPADAEETEAQRALRLAFTERGFAYAQSQYSEQGWAVKEGIEDTEALRKHFVRTFGQPDSTFVTGHSMGGVITIATIESYPEVYDGAMPMCGPLGPSAQFFEEGLFDMLVTFDYLFGDVLPAGQSPVIEATQLAAPIVAAAFEAKPKVAARFAERWQTRLTDLPGALGFFHYINQELAERAGGNPFDNRNTLYSGFGEDRELNDGVRRYAANAKAVEYVRQYYTPTGRVTDPVLALHTTYDQLVNARHVGFYDTLVALAGTQNLFALNYVKADGHCNISAEITGRAFDALRKWVAEGVRPQPGEIH